MKNLSLATVGAACIVLGGVGSAQAATLIDTTPSWNGTQSISAFGEPDTGTYGQTFTVGSDNVLNDFTFYLDDSTDPGAVDFAGYVMAWDGNKATGSILYNSGQQTTTGASGFEQFTFNTGGTSLISGQQYVAFVSASNFFDGTTGTSSMGTTSDVYAGGSFVFTNNGSNFGALTTSSWDCDSNNCFLGNNDAAFTANFTTGSAQAVPEPSSSLGLLTFGAFVAGKFLKRKKAALIIASPDKD